MRYILSDTGYIEEVSFGAEIICNDKNCTEYTGTVPSGYTSLCEWADNANIRAYKIVDGNLVFDSEEDARLQEEYKKCHTQLTISGLPDGSKYECYYIPALNMVWCSIYLTGNAYETGSRHYIGTVEEGYSPTRRTALAMDGLQDYNEVLKANITSDGEIGFVTGTEKTSSDDMYISGWWSVAN